ncbi:MAG: hypothetical protein ACRESZ_07045 [Methylococcales bacterium]
MRRCFIHLGTHKTGTTAIQHLLDRNRFALLQKGYYYPLAGRPERLPGQHNLAWEISRDRRFRDRYGRIDDLINEVKKRSEDVILSSEDFECALHNISRFSDFISVLQSSGFLVIIILYVRNQIDYLARIYLTLLHFGFDSAFHGILSSILDKGELCWREWIFNFDYCNLLRRVDEIAGVDRIVRSYERSRTSICGDFLSIFNLTLRDLQIDDEVFENVSLPLRNYLLMYLQNGLGRRLLENEERVVYRLVPPGANKLDLSPRVKMELLRRFSAVNQSMFNQYGIPEPKMENIDGAQNLPETPYIDELFSENTEYKLMIT